MKAYDEKGNIQKESASFEQELKGFRGTYSKD